MFSIDSKKYRVRSAPQTEIMVITRVSDMQSFRIPRNKIDPEKLVMYSEQAFNAYCKRLIEGSHHV